MSDATATTSLDVPFAPGSSLLDLVCPHFFNLPSMKDKKDHEGREVQERRDVKEFLSSRGDSFPTRIEGDHRTLRVGVDDSVDVASDIDWTREQQLQFTVVEWL